MSYTALYRKFRPNTFADVKGQEAVVQTLKNQLLTKRVGHAYLFCGTRGTGKTTVAKILAKAVNCEHPTPDGPCNDCAMCRAIASGSSLNVVEIDAASNNGVDNIREIREEVAYSPAEGRYKVYIIDEAHMLSTGAFNALLKTLEEPPAYVIFILATTEANRLPVTILSRCQRYDFKRIQASVIEERIRELLAQEGKEAEDKAVRYVARKADGALRDALSLLDQCISFYPDGRLTYEQTLAVLGAVDTEVFSQVLRKILGKDVRGVLKCLDDLVLQGREIGQFVTDFTWYLRNVLLLKVTDGMEELLDISQENLTLLEEDAKMAREETLERFIRIFSELSNQIRFAVTKRLAVEVAMIKLCRPQMERDMTSILERIRHLEEQVASGVAYVPAPGGAGAASETRAAQTETAAEAVAPPKAAPEDLQRVAAMWKSITDEMGNPLGTILHAHAKLRYDANGEDNRLYVVFQDFLGDPRVRDEQTRERLEEVISRKIGKTVEVRMVKAEELPADGARLHDISADELIRQQFAGMEIEVDDRPIEPFE